MRRWVLTFGPAIARNLRRIRPRSSPRWHLDELAIRIAGRRYWMWRAVDDEGEVLDILVQRRRDKHAALKLMRKLIEDDDETVHSITVMVDGSDIDDDQIVAEARRKVDRIMQHWSASRPA